MISLERRSDEGVAVATPSEDRFPWGARIHLEREDLARLNIGEKDVGDTVVITAIAKITDHSINETDEGVHESMGFQITDIDIGEPEQERPDRAATLYDVGSLI